MRKIMILFFAILFLQKNYSQIELPQVIPPSPTVANLMQFEEIPVGYYTGQPNVSVPIFKKSITGDLLLNISLNYNTQSIKINNRSGWTGTGWSLVAGGVVSRTVRGIPDDQKNTVANIGTGVYHNTLFWNYSGLNNYDKQEFLWNSNGTPSDRYDHQLDLFQFNALGISGRFIIVKENGVLIPKLLTKDSNLKIEVDYGDSSNAFQLNAFTITDSRGYRYLFQEKETLSTATFTGTQYLNNDSDYNSSEQWNVINSWYLSRIETSNHKELVSFYYQDDRVNYTTSTNRINIRPTGFQATTAYQHANSSAYNARVLPPKKIYNFTSILNSDTKKLANIKFKDGIELDFVMKQNFIHPETGGSVLEFINIINTDGSVSGKHEFLYDLDSGLNRLWLEKVKEQAGNETNHYAFEYHTKEALPDFDSDSDDWGYIKSENSSACGLVIPNQGNIQTGLLKNIILPTGGSQNFEFERHKITYQGNEILTDEKYRNLNPDNWIAQYTPFTFNHSPGSTHEYTLGVLSIQEQQQEIRYKRLQITANSEAQFNSFIEISNTNGYKNVIRLDEEEVSFTIEPGNYNVKLFTLSPGNSISGEICFGHKVFTPDIKRFVYGGGVRIKSIAYKDDLTSDSFDKKISYEYHDNTIINASSGAIDGLFSGITRHYVKSVSEYVLPESCPFNVVTFGGQFKYSEKSSNVELTKGQYIGYKNVTVFETNNGYKEYLYTSAQDPGYANDVSVFTYPFIPPKNLDYKRGLLLSEKIYDNEKIIKEVDYTNADGIPNYEFNESVITTSYNLYDYPCIWKRFYENYSSYVNKIVANPLNQCYLTCSGDCIGTYNNCGENAPYYFISENINATWTQLKEKVTKDYFYNNLGNQSVLTKKESFDYNDSNYQLKEQNTYVFSDNVNDYYKTMYYYPVSTNIPSNYSGTQQMINKLNQINKVNEILVQEQYKNSVKLSEIHTLYHEFETDLVLPKFIKSLKGNQLSSSTPKTRIIYHSYDSYGNPTEVSQADGTRISYIWGYNGQYPVAKIENATYSQIENMLGQGFDLGNSGLSVGQENSLRNGLSNALISTYIYKPLVGITSMTDPRGYTMTYHYDDLNRLKYVKDEDGNILSKNEYNYKNN